MDSFSFGVVLWEVITKERSQRGNWRPVRVPEECPAEVEALLRVCAGCTSLGPWTACCYLYTLDAHVDGGHFVR